MKALQVDGVEPTSKNVSEGHYRYYKPVLLVTPPAMSATVQKFIAFVRSPAGRDILIRTGHVPMHDFTVAQTR
jgi:phosphate transport system substrate-binding protein